MRLSDRRGGCLFCFDGKLLPFLWGGEWRIGCFKITSPIDPKPGCRFASRCIYACEACRQPQKLEELMPKHFVSCCRTRELS